MRVTIHQPQYLPWLGYLDKIDQADLFVVLDSVQFKKNEWQNRNRIRTAQGWQWLTVPVLHDFGQIIREVRINPSESWRDKHRRALEMHYRGAPYADRYLPGIQDILSRTWTHLTPLNVAMLEWMMASFGIKTPITLASTMKLREEPTDRLVDICRTVGASVYLAGAGATNYMDLERFTASGITMEVQAFQHPVYRQCYDPFVFGLSAVDLLFTWGDGALAYLREARAGGASAQSGSAREDA